MLFNFLKLFIRLDVYEKYSTPKDRGTTNRRTKYRITLIRYLVQYIGVHTGTVQYQLLVDAFGGGAKQISYL